MMEEKIKRAMEGDNVVDITTVGRKSGQSRRIEIRLHNIDGHLYISGTPPRARGWYANLRAHPEFTLHLKHKVRADLQAKATPILDRDRRREIIVAIQRQRGISKDLDLWVEHSPLVAVEIVE